MAEQHRETVEQQGVEAVLLEIGEGHVELLRPLGEDTAVGKFLASRGPGLHHVAYRTNDIDAAKIRRFEELGAPVDAYGVGSSLLRGDNDFTADIVMVDGKPCAKVGRSYRPNPRLERVT